MYALFNIFAPSFSIKESYNKAKLATSKLFSRFKKDKVVVA